MRSVTSYSTFDNSQVGTVNETPLTKKSSPYHFEGFRDLKPLDILFTNDNVIVIREVRYNETIKFADGMV
jgi:hypothetical protein